MKKSWGVVCIGALLGVGCGPDIELQERPLFSNGTNTITILAYDASTGAAVEDATLTLSVGAYELQSRRTGNAYVVSQVPFGTHLARISAPGYISFLGQASGDCSGQLSGPATQCFKTYQAALYPARGVEDNVTVRAFESERGAPVAAGTVVATLTGTSNLLGTGFSNPLPGSLAVRPNTIVATLGADGSAVLPKDQLVLGGAYSVDVFGARSGAGAFLSPAENQTFTAGRDFPQINLFMGPPAVNPVAISVNTERPGAYESLVVSFPFPVEVCSPETDHAWFVTQGNADLNGDGVRALPASPRPVTAAVSGDGSRLTLSANFATTGTGASTFQPSDGRLVIQFSGVDVRVRGSTRCVSMSSVLLRSTGGTISTSLTMVEG